MNPDLLKQLPPDLFPGVIYIYDLLDKGNFYMNTKFEEILGYERGEIAGMGAQVIASLIHPDDKPRVDKVIELLSQSEPGQTVRTEYRMRDKAGNWRWFADCACVSKTDGQGNMAQIVGTALEVTETHEANEAFERIYRLFQILMDVVPLAVCWKDTEGGYLGYNRNFLLSAGLSEGEDIAGKTDEDLPWKDMNAARFRQLEEAVIKSGKPDLNRLEEYTREEGPPLVLRAQRVPIHDGEEVIGVLCLHEDVTDGVVLPKAIEGMEQRYLFVLQTGPLGIFIIEPNSRKIFEANKRAAALIGGTAEGLVEQPLETLFEAEQREELVQWLAKAGEAQPTPEKAFTLHPIDGEPIPVALTSRLVQVENRKIIRVDMRDVREGCAGADTEASAKAVSDLEQTVAKLKEQLAQSQDVLEKSAQKSEAQETAAQKRIAELEKENAALKKELDGMKASKSESSETLKQELKELQASYEKLLKESKELKEALAEAEEELDKLDSQQSDSVERLERENKDLSQALERARAELQTEASRMQKAQETLDAQRAELEEALKQKQAEFEVLEASLKTERASMDTRIAQEREKLERMREQTQVVADLESRLPLARVALDQDFNIIDWNEQARHLYGFVREEVLGESALRLLIPRKERPKFKGYLEAVLEKGAIRNSAFENMNEKRETLTCQWYFSPHADKEGKTCGVDAFVIDTTPIHRAAQAADSGAERMRTLFERQSVPMLVVAAESLRIADANPAAGRFYGISERALSRRSLDDLDVADAVSIRAQLETCTGKEPRSILMQHKLDRGELKDLEVYASPLWDAANDKFYVLIMHDVSGRAQEEKSLREFSEQARLAQAGARDGIWDWNVISDKVSFAERFFEMLGMPARSHWRRMDDFYKLVHLEDLGRLRDQMDELVEAEREHVLVDVRVRVANGDYRWLRVRACAQRLKEAGKADRVVGLVTEISDLKQAVETLREACQAAEKAQEAREVFLVNMSHEIRTPLNAVLGFCELLRDTKLNEDQKDYVERMWKGGHTLLQVLDNVFDLSRIERGDMELEPSYIDPRSFVEEVALGFKRQAEDKGLKLTYSCAEDLPNSFEVDPVRLKQLIGNLLSNALRFTEKGSVKLEVSMEDRQVREGVLCIYVVDTGCGIAKEDQEKIFRVFTQADSATVRKFGGAGLGLALCDRLARLMNGSITLKSKEGKGSTFVVKLKVPVSDSPAFISARSDDNPFRKHHKERRPLNVLFVEDSPLHQDVGKAMLEKIGHEPTIVFNADDALVLLEDEPYDVLMVDLGLPGKPALELVREVRDMGEQEVQPYIIAMASSYSERARKSCLAAGVDDCITTPLRREVAERALNQVYLRKP